MSMQGLSNIPNGFSEAIKEAKALQRRDRKDTIKIKNKPILLQRLVQLYVSGVYTNSQIASLLCVSKRTIDKLLKEPEVLDRIIEYQDEEKKYIDSKLKALRDKSLERLTELIDDADSAVSLSAVKDVLDRTGHAAKKDNNLNITVSYEQRLAELAQNVDTSYIEADFTCEDDNNTEGAVNGD